MSASECVRELVERIAAGVRYQQQMTPRIVIRPAHVSDSDFVAGLVSSLL